MATNLDGTPEMGLNFRRFCHTYVLEITVFLLAGILLVPATLADPKLLYELQINRDYQGPVQRIAMMPSGHAAWMATPKALYEVRDGKAKRVATSPVPGAQLALAPGGGVHAWLVSDNAPQGLFTIQLVATPSTPIAKLRLDKFPFGFGRIFLGEGGRLIVTATPLDDWERLDGRFLYVFWSREGERLADVTLSGRRLGVVDAVGTALLLLGESDAIAFSAAGAELWRREGSYRRGALSAGGKVALLNPARKEAIHEVHIVNEGAVVAVAKMPSPVFDLALAPDVSVGAVAVDKGQIFFIAPQSGKLTEVPRLSIEGTFFITAVRFIDPTTVAVGAIQRAGMAPRFTFPHGAVVAMTTGGVELFHSTFDLEQPASFTPSIDVSYGVRAFAAHTPHNALFVNLDD